jgi:hypothetical protein
MTGRRYTLNDLIDLAGISYAQFKHWRCKRLVRTGAVLQGKYSYYPQETLDEIRAVIAVKTSNRTDADIRDHLWPPADDEQRQPA